MRSAVPPSARDYQLLRQVGSGGFGTVWQGQVVGAGGFVKPVAIKLLNADMAEVAEIAGRLRDEARILASLRHRAIVGVDDLVQIDGRWAVVMEYVDGADLHQLMPLGAIPGRAACEIGREVAAALHAAHSAVDPVTGAPMQIIHRDVKPANVRVSRSGEVKVLDFGVARAAFDRREAQTRSTAYGSVGYMAPERFLGTDTPGSDVYALGVVLLECVTGGRIGQLPVREAVHAAAVEASLAGVPPDAGALVPLLRAMLAQRPTSRPTAAEVARALQDLSVVLRGPWLLDWAPAAVAQADEAPGIELDPSRPGATERPPPAGQPRASPSAPTLDLPVPTRRDATPATVTLVQPAPPATVAPTIRPPRPPAPRSHGASFARSRSLQAGLATVMAAMALLGLLLLLVGWRTLSTWGFPAPEPAAPIVTVAPVETVPPVASAETSPTAAPPAMAAPTPTAAPPATEAVPAPVETLRAEAPAPSSTQPAAAATVGRTSPSPSTTARPSSGDAPSPTRPATGRVVVTGDFSKASLVSANGHSIPPSSAVPVGTYELVVSFPSGTPMSFGRIVTVSEGATVTVRCSAEQEMCR